MSFIRIKKALRPPALLLPLALLSLQAHADKPTWPSLAELLVGSIGNADAAVMSTVMTRCTALHMTLSQLVSSYSPQMSAEYEAEALKMIRYGLLIDSRLESADTGEEADFNALSSSSAEKLKADVTSYSDWMDDNIASGDSLINDEIQMEMDTCQLTSKFVQQMSL
jgi:hypothetical protein